MRLIAILTICCLYCIPLPAQTEEIYNWYTANKSKDIDYTQKLPPQQLQADLDILKLILEEAHTNIYNYSTQAEVHKAFADAISAAGDSLSYLEFVRLVSRIQNIIACGHSNWSHPPAFRKYRDKNVLLLPLDIEIINGKYYIRNNYTGDHIFSKEILAINGFPTDSISAALLRYMSRDGSSNLANELELSENLRYAYSNFIDNPGRFYFDYPMGTGRKQANITGLLRSAIDSIAKERHYNKEMGIPLTFTIDNKNAIAVYKIKWFNNDYITSQRQEFISFTDSVFEQLAKKNIKNLIIDLRGNVGGWTANGRHLFSYFIDKQHPYIKSVKAKKYKDYSFSPLIVTMPEYDDTMKLVVNNGLYEWQNNPNLIANPVSANRFKGNVFILTDGNTRSAASVFCSLMKEHTKAVFIGAETGASQSIQGGMLMTIQLPYSRLLVKFSTARYDLAVSNRSSSGIMPDHRIERTLNFTEEQYMQRVKNIIKQLH